MLLYLAWLVAIFGTLGSLFFGEASGRPPCPLCWYQRICLFPLSGILAVAVYKNSGEIWQYVVYQMGFGICFALYQLLQDYLPGEQVFCGKERGCISKEAFWNIPFAFLSLLCFLTILSLLLLARFSERQEKS